jgi:hypothetical protein
MRVPSPLSVPPVPPTSEPESTQHQQHSNNEASYFMQAAPYAFPGSTLFGEINYDNHMRQGSLSQEQQIELMETLETDGLNEIDNFINLNSMSYAPSIKLEGYSMAGK